jgi:hypothetical protein
MYLISRTKLIQSVEESIKQNKGFAFGKLGFSEQCLLGYLPFKRSNPNNIQLKAYESMLRYHCEIQFGVFPTDSEFLNVFAKFYTNHVRQIDILGVFQVIQEYTIIHENDLANLFIPYLYTEPDRSIPSDESNCYLQYFNGKKLLFISPFADLLKFRANKETFEQVWYKIQKKWFYPSCISSLEIPYSYVNSFQTHSSFNSSIDLFDSICSKISKIDFDVAFIGAGALGLPIASYIKNQGKIGISLGGHLQVLFGVRGSRWDRDANWTSNYMNEFWIEMPEKYHPANKSILTDNGAYW